MTKPEGEGFDMLRLIRLVGGAPTRRKARRQAAQFHASTQDCRAAQRRTLRSLLALNEESDFARDHALQGLAGDVRRFQRAIGVTTYDDYASYVDRLKIGDTRAMLGRDNRLVMFALTSGTTATAKYIPITDRFVRDYRRGWQIWGIHTFDRRAETHFGKIFQLSSDFDKFRTPSGIPCGNISGFVQHMQSRIVRTMYTLPKSLLKVRDPDAKCYAALRLGLADPRVALVMTANPSTLVHFAKRADVWQESLLRDIADGTLSQEINLEPHVRRQLERATRRRNPARSRQLDRLIEQQGRLRLADAWPMLQTVGVWTGGSASVYLPTMRRWMGEVTVRDHGLSASEGRMTIPIDDDTSSGILDIDTHFFEFIPEAEIDSDDPVVLEAHELDEGGTYYILLTTSSGLYRYDIRDVVRCTGFHGTTPVLEFLHKGASISNLTGEKVAESQVVTAVRKSMETTGTELRFFTLAPVWGDPPAYHLVIEASDRPADTTAFERCVENHLAKLNMEYAEKRRSGRLAPIQLHLIPDGTWNRFQEERQSSIGGSVEQYKHPCLVPDVDFVEQFRSQCVKSSA